MILLFVFIHILTQQRIFMDCIQTTAMLEERLEKLERKGIEQEAVIQKLMNDAVEQRLETKAQAERIHDLSMKLEQQAELLVLKEKVISELGHKLDKILDRQYSTDEKFKNMSSDNFNQSSRNQISTLKDDTIFNDNYTTANSEKRSTRQHRLQLPVPTHLPKMNIAFRAIKASYKVNSTEQVLVHDFSFVDLNVGGGFKPSSGNFTAPTSGLYLFTLSVQGLGKPGYVVVSLLKNGKFIDQFGLNSQSHLQHGRSETIIAEVKTGEIVSVDSSIPSDDTVMTIKFSGVLISQM